MPKEINPGHDKSTEGFNWHDRLTISKPRRGRHRVKIKASYGKSITTSLSREEVLLLDLNPLNPQNFSDQAPSPIAPDPYSASHPLIGLALAEAGQYPLLSPGGERALLVRNVAGDPDARERLIRSNLRYIGSEVKEACHHLGNYDQFLDLYQEGYLGLSKALDKFDINRQDEDGHYFRFITYASWIVKGAIQHYFKKNSKTGLSLDENDEIISYSIAGGPRRVTEEKAFSDISHLEHKKLINTLFRYLSPRAIAILSLIHGLNDFEEHSKVEVAEMFRISHQAVSKAENKALYKLKKQLHLDEFKDLLDLLYD
jgi:RNA polymerase sigma factor (sigma-70 family)